MPVSPITAFALLARSPDEVLELDALCVAIARMGRPDLELPAIRAQLDALALEVDVDPAAPPDRLARSFQQAMSGQLRLTGSHTNWRDPRSSFIDVVLERRNGLPILLSTLWVLLGQRLGVPIKGVGWPGQFLVCLDAPGARIYLDPYADGRVRQPADLLAEAGPGARPYLNPISTRAIGLRMLINLKHLWVDSEDWGQALGAIDRILLLSGEDPLQLRDRGLVALHLGRTAEAARDLRRYLSLHPEAEDQPQVRHILERLGAKT